MSLPPLDKLALAPTGMDGEQEQELLRRIAEARAELERAVLADREQARWNTPMEEPPQARRGEAQARPAEPGLLVPDRPLPVFKPLDPEVAWSYGPRMVCVQDQNDASLSAARVVYDFLQRYRDRTDGYSMQFDDPAEAKRYNDAVDSGRAPPSPPKAFQPWLLAHTMPPLNLVKARLSTLVGTVCRELRALAHFGPAGDPRNNLGFTVTLTDRYGEADRYQFHTDMHEDGARRFLPQGVHDWHMLTLVYYLVPPDSEAKAATRPGQGSTLLNMSNAQAPDAQTQVAFCPLQNGTISVIDGTRWHAVGINYDLARGAVTLKAVIYKPGSAARKWSHAEWWSRVDSALRDFASGGDARGNEYRLVEHGVERLSKAMERPEGYEGV
jgi:hypothetical protein